MGGVQAQYAPSIYIGLWSRVEGLERDQVTRALERRALVQATLLRNTIHVVSPRRLLAVRRGHAGQPPELVAPAPGEARAGGRGTVEAAARRMRRAARGRPRRPQGADAARGRGRFALQRRHALARRGARAAGRHLGAPPRRHLRSVPRPGSSARSRSTRGATPSRATSPPSARRRWRTSRAGPGSRPAGR